MLFNNLLIAISINWSWFKIDFSGKITCILTIFNFNFNRNHWTRIFIVKPVQILEKGKRLKLDSFFSDKIYLWSKSNKLKAPISFIITSECFWQNEDQFDGRLDDWKLKNYLSLHRLTEYWKPFVCIFKSVYQNQLVTCIIEHAFYRFHISHVLIKIQPQSLW